MSKGIWNQTREKLNSIHKVWLDLDSTLVSTQQIAKRIGIDWHTALKYLKQLEGQGLVKGTEIKTGKKKMVFWEKKKGKIKESDYVEQ
jgi:DNA-binding transcriptional regulator YhcF (GntR family)